MKSWIQAASLYRDPKVFGILLLGFSSGIPFLLILSTLSVWLAEVGTTKTQIGLLAWVTLPYAFKFIWAPFVDSHKVPLFCTFFGQRRGWLLFSQCMLMATLIGLGCTDPANNMLATTGLAFLVGFFSATQDIVIEAYRIEALPREYRGVGAGASVLGYRLGMLMAGAGALYIAHYFSWKTSYFFMGLCIVVGILTSLLSPEPTVSSRSRVHGRLQSAYLNASDFGDSVNFQGLYGLAWFRKAILEPLLLLARKHGFSVIIPFLLFYKIGDTILNTMSMPFLIEIGFSKVEIAQVAKTFGITAMIVGGVIGGVLLSKQTLRHNLMLCAGLQLIASFLFMIQAMMGYNLGFLFMTVGVENLACGMSQAALLAYLSSLCMAPHTATHYALLSSFASFSRIGLSMIAGWVAEHLAWSQFYGVTMLGCVPAIILLLVARKHFEEPLVEPQMEFEEAA